MTDPIYPDSLKGQCHWSATLYQRKNIDMSTVKTGIVYPAPCYIRSPDKMTRPSICKPEITDGSDDSIILLTHSLNTILNSKKLQTTTEKLAIKGF